MKDSRHKLVVLFDGYCALCSASVQFIAKRDLKKLFCYIPLQSEQGTSMLKKHNMQEPFEKSLVLIEETNIHLKSDAALIIAKNLGQPWALFYFLIFVPRFIRDAIYTLIAKNRFKWFGKRDTCFIIKDNTPCNP